MTDTELFEIVKGHREAWPSFEDGKYRFLQVFENGHWNDDPSNEELWGVRLYQAQMLFEASFHRALMQRGDVYTAFVNPTYHVQIADHTFTGGSLIEAYAKALEWLK